MFNETYDLMDFNSFAEFIQNAKSVIESENCEFTFHTDTNFTDRGNVGWISVFNPLNEDLQSPLMFNDIHFADDTKPRMCLSPRRVQNANILRWENNTWRLDLDFVIENCEDVTSSIYSNKSSGNVNYSDIYIARDGAGNNPRLIVRLVGKMFESPYQQWEEVSLRLQSLPISESNPSAYIDDNDDSYIYDSEETPKEYSNPPKLYYMYSSLYSVNADYGDKQKQYTNKVEFKVPSGVRFCYYTNNDKRSNVILELDDTTFEVREETNGVWSDWQTRTHGDLGIYKNGYFADIENDSYIEFHNRYYYSSCFTNIPKAKNKEDADRYLDYLINDDEMRIQQKEHPNKTGDGLNSQTSDLHDNSVRAVLSRLYRLDYANLVKISNVIFNTDASEMTSLLKGLEMYGNNPIACITDLYYTPIDLTDFIDGTITNGMKFGSYLAEPSGLSVTQVNFNHGIKQLTNTFIFGQYGDWRDTYFVKYKLYLPFVGIVDLDGNIYVDRTLTIKVTYDLRSHNMKYYLFADNKLVQTYEASLGVAMVIMGNDTSAKASQNLQSVLGMTRGVSSLALSMGAPVNPVGIASSIGDMAMNVGSTIVNMNKEAPTTISGNISPASACNDIFYPYLIIQTQEHDYPTKLVSQFGMPCNVVNLIGNSRGFTIADNINLQGNMLDEEKKEIISLFKGGVII